MVQQLAITTVNGGMIRHDEPKQHSSTSPGCADDNGTYTALWPPDYPDRDSDRDATSIPAMKIRHLNPRQMISIPEHV